MTEILYAKHLALCWLYNTRSNNVLSLSTPPLWAGPLSSHFPFAYEGDEMPQGQTAKIDRSSSHDTLIVRRAVRNSWLQLLNSILRQWTSYWKHAPCGLHRVGL